MFDLPAKPDLSVHRIPHAPSMRSSEPIYGAHKEQEALRESSANAPNWVHRVERLYPLIADKNINLVPNNYKRLVK